MSKFDQASILRFMLRNDLSSFIRRAFNTVDPGSIYQHNWHIDAIAEHLEAVERGDVTRLIITMPPRSLKSISASVAFPAWVLGRNPKRQILAASYAESLSLKLARDCLKVLQTEWYKDCFPGARIAKDLRGRRDFETTRGGGRFSTSVGGTVTGRGGSLLLIDDPHKPEEASSDVKRKGVLDWYSSTFATRADDPVNTGTVLVQQRIHELDLAGFLLEQGDWVHLNLPAVAEVGQVFDLGRRGSFRRGEGDLLHPERLTQAVLDRRKVELGSYGFAAQYQQRPAPLEGGLIKWNWFKTYDQAPQNMPMGQTVQSWDTASAAGPGNDYSVCTTWRVLGNSVWLLDVYRGRLEFPDLIRRVEAEADKWNAGQILIERAGSGISLIQELHQRTRRSVIGHQPTGDKVTRLEGVTHAIEAGRVVIPTEAPWLADLRDEMLHFPNGKHDDQVDSLSQFLIWFLEPKQVAIQGLQK